MRKTPKLTLDELKLAVMSMDYIDRICLLTASIVNNKKDEPVAAMLGLAELIGRITPYLAADKRLLVGEHLRSCADRCDGAVMEEMKNIGGG